jgi:hypothetical protein
LRISTIIAGQARGTAAAGAAEAVGARPFRDLRRTPGHAQNLFIELPEQRAQAAPGVARRRPGLILDPAGLAVAPIQQADRLQCLRIEFEAGHRLAARQGQAGFAHQQAAAVEDEGQHIT